jgi:hypothetical protein
MTERPDSTPLELSLPTQENQEMVAILVSSLHPLLRLKAALDWQAIEAVMVKHWRQAGKNVDFGRGLPFPVSLYVPLLVLMAVKGLNPRQAKEYIEENVYGRKFLGLEKELDGHVRDHSNISRAQAALGQAGYEQVNQLLVKEALALGFAKLEVLSSDTTVQEPVMGYPNEAGILRGVAQRVRRAVLKLKKQGYEHGEGLLQQAKEVLHKVKHYHLFTKGKAAKDLALKELVEGSAELLLGCQKVVEEIASAASGAAQSALKKLRQMKEFGAQLLPQINSWLASGVVAAEKLLHPTLTDARALVKNKAGKKLEFGLKWLINRIQGGYVFGEVVPRALSESRMPLRSLKKYREIFGQAATPEMVVYDRGGSDGETEKKLAQAGVKKIGIQPKGKKEWLVAEEDQKAVLSHRGKTEGVIGSLKAKRYDFNKGRQRSNESLMAAGHRAILGLNLNNLIRDLMAT